MENLPPDSPGATDAAAAVPGGMADAGVTSIAANAIERLESALQQGLSAVLRAFEEKIAYDASKQKQIDQMHAELVERRTDLVARAARPLINGIIRLHDDIGSIAKSLQNKSSQDLSPQKVDSLLKGLQEDIEIFLQQNGITSFREPGSAFNPRRQRAVRTIPTTEAVLAGQIAEQVRPGFEQGAELIEKERVATYEFKPTPTTATQEN